MGSIPGQGTKILQATRCGRKEGRKEGRREERKEGSLWLLREQTLEGQGWKQQVAIVQRLWGQLGSKWQGWSRWEQSGSGCTFKVGIKLSQWNHMPFTLRAGTSEWLCGSPGTPRPTTGLWVTRSTARTAPLSRDPADTPQPTMGAQHSQTSEGHSHTLPRPWPSTGWN